MTYKLNKDKPTLHKLLPGKLKRAEFERVLYRIRLDQGVTLEDILKPEFWAHIGKSLKPFDIIECVFHDGQKYVELLVIDAANLWAKVAIKQEIDLVKAVEESAAVREAVSENGDYEIAYKGPTAKWTVIRKTDNERVQTGLSAKKDAEQWLENFLKAMAA